MPTKLSFFHRWGRPRIHVRRFNHSLDHITEMQGAILAKLDRSNQSPVLADHEFRAFSQWGDDGILQFLTRVVAIENRTFIEFGVEDFRESNCRFLMVNDGWQGFVIDGSEEDVSAIRRMSGYWRHSLRAKHAFIDRENIESLLAESRFDLDLGILSIDIDGNDYFVLDAIKAYRPRILICEYNSVFGPDDAVTVPYDPGFQRTQAHHSNLYFGASIRAITLLAESKGYVLVGGNSAGNNVFFVRGDLMTDALAKVAVEDAYVVSRFRESRSESGKATWLEGAERRQLISHLEVLDVVTGQTRALGLPAQGR